MADDLFYAIDVSNYQGSDITGLIEEQDPQRVIIRASHESADMRQIAVEQCKDAYFDHGRGVDMYDWPYPWESPIVKVHADLAIAADAGLPGIGTLLLDLEEGTLEDLGPDGMCDWTDQFGQECMRIGLPCVVYTRRTYWQHVTGNSGRCSWLYLLACQPDEVPTLESVIPYGGWTHESGLIIGKQWSFAGGVDRDIVAQSVYGVQPVPIPEPPVPIQPLPEPPPGPDPCKALRTGVQSLLDRRPYRAPSRQVLRDLLAGKVGPTAVPGPFRRAWPDE